VQNSISSAAATHSAAITVMSVIIYRHGYRYEFNKFLFYHIRN